VNILKPLLDARQALSWRIWLVDDSRPAFEVRKFNNESAVIYPLENAQNIINERLEISSENMFVAALELLENTFQINPILTGPVK